MILHTVNKPAAWVKCSDLIGPHDEIVLLEDGVYLALTKIKRLRPSGLILKPED